MDILRHILSAGLPVLVLVCLFTVTVYRAESQAVRRRRW